MKCEKCKELLIAYSEQLLDEADKLAVEAHLNDCQQCREQLSQLSKLRERLVKNGNRYAASDLGDAVMNRIVRKQAFELRKMNESTKHFNFWRTIMTSKITKLAVAAAVLVAISMAGWFLSAPDAVNSVSPFELLAKASAAEQALFTGEGIVHIVNEITIYRSPYNIKTDEMIEKLGDLQMSGEELDAVNRELVKSWMVGWFPMCSLGADGEQLLTEIRLTKDFDQPYTIYDHAWYEPATGRFVRIMETEGRIIFANSYDGDFVHLSQTSDDGTLSLKSEAVASDFRAPENPAGFLGITAGVRQCLSDKCLAQPVKEVIEDKLEDGTAVFTYKVGFSDFWGELNTYYLFKVSRVDEIIAEIECIYMGQKQMVIRRILSESVEGPDYSWNLAEIDAEEVAGEQPTEVTVASDVAIPNVSVRHIVETANFETYIFATDPSWTQERIIIDVANPMNPDSRMPIVLYTAEDGRHIILVQSDTHNKYLTAIFKQIEAHGQTSNGIVYPNGYKVYTGVGGENFWVPYAFKNAGFEPAEDCSGYIIETPAGTFPMMAVNGQLTEQELESLVNSLIPAREYTVK